MECRLVNFRLLATLLMLPVDKHSGRFSIGRKSVLTSTPLSSVTRKPVSGQVVEESVSFQ